MIFIIYYIIIDTIKLNISHDIDNITSYNESRLYKSIVTKIAKVIYNQFSFVFVELDIIFKICMKMSTKIEL